MWLIVAILFVGLSCGRQPISDNASQKSQKQTQQKTTIPVPPLVHKIQNPNPQKDTKTIVENLTVKKVFNKTKYILLLGFDKSGKLPGRTDAMMIVAIRHKSNDIGVISIPRDLWVDIPGAPPGRINKVFRVGNILHGKGGGYRLIKQVIKKEMGIKIDHAVTVDFSGFVHIVDLLGGIDVDVACPIRDNFISHKSETGYETLFVKTGRNRMSGKTALLFSRSRHGRSDLDRARRQQAVLMGLNRRLMSLDIIPKAAFLWKEIKQNLATDISLETALQLVSIARTANAGQIHGMVIKKPLVFGWRSPEGKSVLRLNHKLLKKELDSLFVAPIPGTHSKPVCRPVDVALNWKELARKKHGKKTSVPNITPQTNQ